MPDEDVNIEVFFPFLGLSEHFAFAKQPSLTSGDMRNVRPYDVEEERARGGQRPGLLKVYSTRVGGDHPIIGMTQITTTYLGVV